MIYEVTGDILLSQAQLLAHGVAPGDHFASGLALALRERWPAMVKDFRHYCHTAHPQPGALWLWAGADGKRIANLLTQPAAPDEHAHPGPARLEHVGHALKALRRIIEEEHVTSVALPRLATGVGALAWHDVQPLVRERLGDLPIPVYVYTTYKANQSASEG